MQVKGNDTKLEEIFNDEGITFIMEELRALCERKKYGKFKHDRDVVAILSIAQDNFRIMRDYWSAVKLVDELYKSGYFIKQQ